MRGHGFRVALPARVGQADVDAPPVRIAHVPLNQAMLLQSAY